MNTPRIAIDIRGEQALAALVTITERQLVRCKVRELRTELQKFKACIDANDAPPIIDIYGITQEALEACQDVFPNVDPFGLLSGPKAFTVRTP